MLNENIIRDYSVNIFLSDINRIINSRATFNQRDIKTAVLVVNIFDNKKDKRPINLTDTIVIGKILKNDNTTSVLQCSIIDELNGTVAIGFTEQTLITIGDNKIELVIQSGEQILYTPKIIYSVSDNLFDESNGIESTNEFPILGSLINSVQILNAKVEQTELVIQTNEETRNTSEVIRDQNETIRNTNEADRTKTFTDLTDTFDVMTNAISNKMTEIDKVIADTNISVNEAVKRLDTFVNNANTEIADIIQLTNTEFDGIKTSFDNMSKTFSDYILSIDSKLISCSQAISKMETLHTTVTADEVIRNKNEKDRINTFNGMISSLDVNSSDIDDIINMVGGGL